MKNHEALSLSTWEQNFQNTFLREIWGNLMRNILVTML